MQEKLMNFKGFAKIIIPLIIVIILLLSAIIIYNQYHSQKSNGVSNTNTSSHSSTSKQIAANPYTGWSQYCSQQEKSCFKYPASWTAKDIGAVDPNGDGLQLTSPRGTIIWFQSVVSGLGGGCEGTPDIYTHKVINQSHVQGLYIVEYGTRTNTNRIALVDADDGVVPKVGDGPTCYPKTSFKSKQNSSASTWFKSNGTSNLKGQDLNTAELILESYSY